MKQKDSNRKIIRQNFWHKLKIIMTTDSISSILKNRPELKPKKRKFCKTINYSKKDSNSLKIGGKNIYSNTIKRLMKFGTEHTDHVWVSKTRYKIILCFMVLGNSTSAHQKWKIKYLKDNMLKSSNTSRSFTIS